MAIWVYLEELKLEQTDRPTDPTHKYYLIMLERIKQKQISSIILKKFLFDNKVNISFFVILLIVFISIQNCYL